MDKNNAVQPTAGDSEGGRVSYVPTIYKVIMAVLGVTSVGLLAGVIVLATSGSSTTVPASSTSEVVKPPTGTNPCAGTKPATGFDNLECENALEQSGSNVTLGYKGDLITSAVPITVPYFKAGLCPVNVHWHLGAEHLSVGQYDTDGVGPADDASSTAHRRRADDYGEGVRQGHRCLHYDSGDEKFTKPYHWEHCIGMVVGETYEVHWPHSKGGACGTPNQYQTPFYDGVFCNGAELVPTTQEAIGVQAQVFVIVNDEDYYYPDLFRGMIVDDIIGTDIAYYTGSTTGTTRDNEICSAYAPITWQVDRKCQMVSASTFDKMCMDMKAQRDDMSDDLHPHGSRELVDDEYAANNHQRR